MIDSKTGERNPIFPRDPDRALAREAFANMLKRAPADVAQPVKEGDLLANRLWLDHYAAFAAEVQLITQKEIGTLAISPAFDKLQIFMACAVFGVGAMLKQIAGMSVPEVMVWVESEGGESFLTEVVNAVNESDHDALTGEAQRACAKIMLLYLRACEAVEAQEAGTSI